MINYTKGEWKVTYLPQTKQPIVVNESGDLIAAGLGGENAQLIVTAVNACIKVNPGNPLAVAESISDLYEACRAIISSETIKDKDNFNQALEALAKVEKK